MRLIISCNGRYIKNGVVSAGLYKYFCIRWEIAGGTALEQMSIYPKKYYKKVYFVSMKLNVWVVCKAGKPKCSP